LLGFDSSCEEKSETRFTAGFAGVGGILDRAEAAGPGAASADTRHS
jgi:hypothetical protein